MFKEYNFVFSYRNRDSVVGVVTRLRPPRSGVRISSGVKSVPVIQMVSEMFRGSASHLNSGYCCLPQDKVPIRKVDQGPGVA